MRSLLLFLIVLSTLPIILVKPHVGLLVYSWLGYMSPHRLTYGIAYDFPFAFMIGAVMLTAWIFSREPKKIPITFLSFMMLVWTAWFCMTTVLAVMPDGAMVKFDRTIKIMVTTFLTMALIYTRKRLYVLIWVIVASLGFYAIKGGFFVLLTGGQSRVFGPKGSFIHDNNQLALALIMILPLMRYLQIMSPKRWQKWAIGGWMALNGLTILGTQSRGAAVAGAVMLLTLVMRSRQKLLLSFVMVIGVALGFTFMPAKYHDRLATIANHEEDNSANSRLRVWRFSFEYTKSSPIIGGGFGVFGARELHERYDPEYQPGDKLFNAHSVWFEVMAENGFVGLGIFVIIGLTALLTCGRIRKATRGDPERLWAFDLASSLQVSFIGYAVAGTFLNLVTFDLYWQLLAVTVLLSRIVAVDTQTQSAAVMPNFNAGQYGSRSSLANSRGDMIGSSS